MVKKVNKLMTIMTLVGAGVVGVNSVETLTTNVYAYETSNTIYLARTWFLWDSGEDSDGSKRLMVKEAGGTWQDNFGVLFGNKTAIFGSKDIYINLKGTYNLSFVDHHNKDYYNYSYGDIYADTIIFDAYDIRFLLNSDLVASFDMIDIRLNLNDSEDFYIISLKESFEYQQGFGEGYQEGFDEGYQSFDKGYQVGYDEGYQEGYDFAYDYGKISGYNEGRKDYGILFHGGWQTAEWYGDYQYKQGLNETDATGFVGLLSAVFGGLGSLLAIELLPNIYLGAIIAVPLVFGVLFFILGKRKGD